MMCRRVDAQETYHRNATCQVIAHAVKGAALPAITSGRRSAAAASAAVANTPVELGVGGEEAPRKVGPLPPPVDGEPTLLIVVRDPALALSLGEKAAAEGIKVS